MKFEEEKEQLVKLGMKKQKVIEMEKKRDKIGKKIQKIKDEQTLMLMHNELYQMNDQKLDEKTNMFNELEQKIEEERTSISEQVERIKIEMENKIIEKMTQYEEELASGDKSNKKKYIKLTYALARLNNLEYDSLPVCKEKENKEDKEKER